MKRWFGRQAVAWLGRFCQARDRLLTLAVCGAFGRFGKGSRIVWPLRMGGTLDGVEFGSDVYLGSGCWLQAVAKGGNPKPRILIGNRVLASGSLVLSAAEEILIEDSVLFARNVYISDHIHRYDLETPIRDQGVAKIAPVRIGKGAWLGQNVVVCPGVTIGAGAVIGAGSVVNKDIPPRCLAVGSPARVVRQHPVPSGDAPSL